MKMNEGPLSDQGRDNLSEARAEAILPPPPILEEMTPLPPEGVAKISEIAQLSPELKEMDERLIAEGRGILERRQILEDLAISSRRSSDEGLERVRLQGVLGYSGQRIEENADRFSSNAPGESGEFNTVAPPVVRERGIGPEDETPLQGKVTETRAIGRIPLVKKAF